jgi:hypothetical protein
MRSPSRDGIDGRRRLARTAAEALTFSDTAARGAQSFSAHRVRGARVLRGASRAARRSAGPPRRPLPSPSRPRPAAGGPRTASEALTFSETATRQAYLRARTAAEALAFSETAQGGKIFTAPRPRRSRSRTPPRGPHTSARGRSPRRSATARPPPGRRSCGPGRPRSARVLGVARPAVRPRAHRRERPHVRGHREPRRRLPHPHRHRDAQLLGDRGGRRLAASSPRRNPRRWPRGHRPGGLERLRRPRRRPRTISVIE